jgi:predicted transcriptional regulator
MKTSLLDILFMSEKRKGVLLLLHEGPKRMEAFLTSLKTTRQALLPQIRILESNHLVYHNRDIYELTTIGKIIVEEMKPLLGTVRVLERYPDYWGRHDLSLIPPYLMERLRELGDCTLVIPSLQEMHDFNREVHEKSKESGSFFEVASSFKSDFHSLFSELAQKGISMSFIISKELQDHLQRERHEEFKEYLENERTQFYMYPEEMPFLSFVGNDFCLLLELLTRDGSFDNTQLVCCNPGALAWGRELFDFYRTNSTQITGI